MKDTLSRKIGAVGLTVGLAWGIAYGAGWITTAAARAGGVHLGGWAGGLDHLYAHHAVQLLLGLLCIAVAKRLAPADYTLHWPRGRSWIGSALAWGAAFGVLMTLVDYAPELLSHRKPSLGYPLTPVNVTGWLVFEGLYVGPTEEIPFRALLVTLLGRALPARVRGFGMRWAGVIVALLFALLHADNFWIRPWPLALGQQIYAFALGVLYAYWLERSGSVVAPIVGHNAGDFVEYVLVFAWVWLG